MVTMSNALASKKITTATRVYLAQVVQDVLADPDFGRNLTDEAKKRLDTSGSSRKTVSLAEIRKRYR